MTNPIAVQGFDHIVLRVQDKARMLTFYCDVLGLSVDKEQPHVGLTHIRAGPQLIDLITLDGPLGKLGGAAPGAEGRNLDHFACRSVPSTRPPSAPIWPPTASRSSTKASATGPTATATPSTSTTPRAIRWS